MSVEASTPIRTVRCLFDERAFVVELQGETPISVSVWTKGRHGARDCTRTLWRYGRCQTMSRMVTRTVAAAKRVQP
jgi:hypothetical protein